MITMLKIKTNTLKAVLLLSLMNVAFACSNANPNTAKTDTTTQAVKGDESITINGVVTKITNGKDGYIADVQTETEGTYAALVSISNMGGPEKYQACKVGDKVSFKGIPSTSGNTKTLKVTEIISISPYSRDTQMLISSTGFRGIEIGDAISKHSDYVKKTKLKTGEGSFDAYEIRDFENNPAGYFMPNLKNKLLVGDITVESPKASTDKGIKIGSTFKELLNVFPNIEIHGSESEGRTYATANHISYRLAMPNFSYDVDKAKIPAATKIIQILINQSTSK